MSASSIYRTNKRQNSSDESHFSPSKGLHAEDAQRIIPRSRVKSLAGKYDGAGTRLSMDEDNDQDQKKKRLSEVDSPTSAYISLDYLLSSFFLLSAAATRKRQDTDDDNTAAVGCMGNLDFIGCFSYEDKEF